MIFQSSCIKRTGLREKITLKTVFLPLKFKGENPATSSYLMPINHLEKQKMEHSMIMKLIGLAQEI